MTSDVRKGQEVEIVEPSTHGDPPCLCCVHFAIDFDAMPDAHERKRPSRHPKRSLDATS